MPDTEPVTSSPQAVEADEPTDVGVVLTEAQVKAGYQIWLVPAQEGIEQTVSVKAKSYAAAISLAKKQGSSK